MYNSRRRIAICYVTTHTIYSKYAHIKFSNPLKTLKDYDSIFKWVEMSQKGRKGGYFQKRYLGS